MFYSTTHKMRHSFRRLSAVILTTLYLLIAMSPLAPLAMHSKMVAQAVAGGCTGNCLICECSQESRERKTCCCAKTKQLQAGVAKLSPDRFLAQQSATAPAPATEQQTEPEVATNDCCAKNGRYQHNKNFQEAQIKEDRSKSKTFYKCGWPCGKGKLLALTGAGSSELLPYIYADKIVPPHEDTHFSNLSQRMTTRHADPPDPPPKLPASA
jgi:hypothetical protein